jgi:hypothetical protein
MKRAMTGGGTCTRAALLAVTLCAACSRGDRDGLGSTTIRASGHASDHVSAVTGVTRLAGSMQPRARPEADFGRLDPDVRIEGASILLAPSHGKSEREALLAQLQDPGSPLYHAWLMPEDFAGRFGALPGDLQRVTSWLKQQGLQVLGTARTGLRVFFSGTAGQFERAFDTEMHRYWVDGDTHFAMAKAPAIPADLESVVMGLHGTDDFRPKPPRRSIVPDYLGAGSGYELSPADFATIYDVAPLYAASIDGTGQKIAIAAQTDIVASDVATFRSTFGLSPQLPTDVLVPNSGSLAVSQSDLGEAELDCEWAGAVGKNATIMLVTTGDNTNYGVFDSVLYAIESSVAPVLSLSYGYCESGATPADAIFYETMGDAAAMFGISLVASAGDEGAAACDGSVPATTGLYVMFPADIATVTAVGGTDIVAQPASMYYDPQGYAISYIPETGWDDTNALGVPAAGGGGASRIFAKPAWQTGVTPNDGVRDVPDVSFSASPITMPYLMVLGGQVIPQGGTSASTPSFAGVLSLVNQAIGAARPGLGNANPMLYALAHGVPGAFHDVTKGNNVVACRQGTPDCPTSAPFHYGYRCSTGYDQVTGIGSVDVANLVDAWKSLVPTATSLTATAQGTTEGSPLQLVATISSEATTTPMSSDVTFYYYTLDSRGAIDVSYPLGTVPVTPTSSPTEGATAALMTHAPPGLLGNAKVVAFYVGDEHYLSSWSSMSTVTAISDLKVMPASITASPAQTVHFTASGGQAPYVWWLQSVAANSDSTIDVMSGVYTASDAGPGQEQVLVIDSYGAEALANVFIVADGGAADGGAPPQDSGPVHEAGRLAEGGASADAEPRIDAPEDDATGSAEAADASKGGSSTDGCTCSGAGTGGGAGGQGILAAVAGILALASRGARRGRQLSHGRRSRT